MSRKPLTDMHGRPASEYEKPFIRPKKKANIKSNSTAGEQARSSDLLARCEAGHGPQRTEQSEARTLARTRCAKCGQEFSLMPELDELACLVHERDCTGQRSEERAERRAND